MNQETDPIQSFTVFVGGLNFQTDESSLKCFFSGTPHISGIKNVRICRRIEGTSKGFGYVTFNNKFSYIQSLSLNGYLLDGKSIRVEADHSKLTLSNKKESKKPNNLYASSVTPAPVKKKKSKSHSELSESSSEYSSYSYSSSSYSAYSSDSEKRNQNNRHKNKKRKHRDYSDYSYSS